MEKTGYPQDMLDLIPPFLKPISGLTPLSRRRCSPPSAPRTNIPRDENVKLRDYPTLAHVIGFVIDKRPDLAAAAPVPVAPVATAQAKEEIKSSLAPAQLPQRPTAQPIPSKNAFSR